MSDAFAAALRRAGLVLDPRDTAAALPVFRYLEEAKRKVKDADERG